MVDKEKEKMGSNNDLANLSILLSQHDDEGDDSESNLDAEENYKNVMAKPLFNTDEDELDDDDDNEEAKKGVHWGADVADHSRKEAKNKAVHFGNAQSNPNAGIVALNMNRTKIGFD